MCSDEKYSRGGDGVKKCPSCGKLIIGSTTVCKKCGASLIENDDIYNTIQGGIDAMEEGDLPLATYRWTEAVKANGDPSDIEYKGMLKSTFKCILKQVNEQGYRSREGMGELASYLHQRLYMEDVMYTLGTALPTMSSKSKVGRLAAEYMYIALESFNVYPDLRYMVHLMDVAHDTMVKFQQAFSEYQGPDDGEGKELTFYAEFTAFVAERIQARIDVVGDEELEQAIEYWKRQVNLEYGDKVIFAANAASKIYMSKGFKDIHVKTRDSRVESMIDAYFDAPRKSNTAKNKN